MGENDEANNGPGQTQVKLMIYYLQTNLAAHEIQNGRRVVVPIGVFPPEPPPPAGELEDNPIAKAMFEDFRKRREEFIAANK